MGNVYMDLANVDQVNKSAKQMIQLSAWNNRTIIITTAGKPRTLLVENEEQNIKEVEVQGLYS